MAFLLAIKRDGILLFTGILLLWGGSAHAAWQIELVEQDRAFTER